MKKLLATVTLLAVLSGCASHPEKRKITVFAAASLSQVFGTIEKEMEAADPELDVVISYDGSQNLVDQLVSGAPADVLATADAKSMRRAEDKLQLKGTRFATNSLVLITQQDNPRGLTAANEQLNEVKTVVCAPEVPCGAATQKVFSQFPWQLRPASQEQKVTDVVGKVRSGQADAGVVYRTDATGFHAIAIPGAEQHLNEYFIAPVRSESNPVIDFVLSDRGQSILRDAGFGA